MPSRQQQQQQQQRGGESALVLAVISANAQHAASIISDPVEGCRCSRPPSSVDEASVLYKCPHYELTWENVPCQEALADDAQIMACMCLAGLLHKVCMAAELPMTSVCEWSRS